MEIKEALTEDQPSGVARQLLHSYHNTGFLIRADQAPVFFSDFLQAKEKEDNDLLGMLVDMEAERKRNIPVPELFPCKPAEEDEKMQEYTATEDEESEDDGDDEVEENKGGAWYIDMEAEESDGEEEESDDDFIHDDEEDSDLVMAT
ncbi:unnamed protein product [Orchesella dallaii]|uniref:Uncharacterized protein n=1 Tax=Orchesella dallaii TaxID=48710 RepID=A0ABP1QCN3_9HEXA